MVITRITCKMYWKKRELKTDVANLLMDFSCITYKQWFLGKSLNCLRFTSKTIIPPDMEGRVENEI